MRTIYVDVFFIINMFEDFLFLLCVKRIIHSDVKYLRIIGASLLGAVFSFTAFLPFNHFPINLLLNIIISSILTFICFGYKSRRMFFKSVITLYIISILFSGAMIFFYLAFKPDGMIIINNSVYFNISPAVLIILTFLIYIILFFFRRIFKNHIRNNQLYIFKFLLQNNNYEIKCKVDSGCNVKEPFSGSSVIIVEADTVKNTGDSFRIIPFNSLGGNGLLRGFKAEKAFINDKKINEEIYIGLYNGSFQGEIQGLIPETILKD